MAAGFTDYGVKPGRGRGNGTILNVGAEKMPRVPNVFMGRRKINFLSAH